MPIRYWLAQVTFGIAIALNVIALLVRMWEGQWGMAGLQSCLVWILFALNHLHGCFVAQIRAIHDQYRAQASMSEMMLEQMQEAVVSGQLHVEVSRDGVIKKGVH